MQTSTVSAGNSLGGKTTLEIIEAMKEALSSIPECPIKAFMKTKDADPDKGWAIVLPIEFLGNFGPLGAPYYVKFSRLVSDAAYLINTTGLRIDNTIKLEMPQFVAHGQSILNMECNT